MNYFSGKIVRQDSLMFTADQGMLSFPLPEHDNLRLFQYLNKAIVLGIRPEHIHSRALSRFSLAMTVNNEITEPVGNEIFLYFVFPGTSMQYTSRILSDSIPQSGNEFILYFDASKFHYFDPITGKSL